MSTVQLVEEQEYPCSHDDCDATRTPNSSVRGSFCSVECAARDLGEAFLEDVRHDHRFCWSCFRTRKNIERPTDEARRGLGPITDAALVGYEYYSEHVEMGPHGLECECGAVDHDIPDWEQLEDGPFHWYLTLISEQLAAEGQREDTIDIVVLANIYWARDDLALAVGGALMADS